MIQAQKEEPNMKQRIKTLEHDVKLLLDITNQLSCRINTLEREIGSTESILE